jgi:hypothetical protein
MSERCPVGRTQNRNARGGVLQRGVRLSGMHVHTEPFPGPSIISGANEIWGAKLGANTHHHLAMPGHVRPQSLLADGTPGHVQPCPATAITRLTSEGPVVRAHLRPLFTQVRDLQWLTGC